uniref:Uncharacterized protein AlNc14C567G12165 n=1 Tax=Albugo laibachii Nc14 TaxID=890382 RepID=F0X171_9STRA|nr:conserved unknown protein putative [Albugo laibachii Nc14]|eukprot:CCA27529.1 conserved unknown protein putative [Albugo laibachii Nc14]
MADYRDLTQEASHPFSCVITIPFESHRDASYAMQTLLVDKELQPEKIIRELRAVENDLIVEFRTTEARLLRAAVSSFYDMVLLIARVLMEFEE